MDNQSKNLIIKREYILSFCQQQGITNIQDFLQAISQQKEEFAEFLSTLWLPNREVVPLSPVLV